MNNDILFSIIMPFYNSENYIKDAVLSVINQTFQNWELIAVNDGSLDSSKHIVESFNDKRIKIFNKKNGGYQSAINYGLNNSSGDYILFLGSDDQLFPNILTDLFNSIKQKNPDIVAFNTIKYFKESGREEMDQLTNYSKDLYFDGTLRDLEQKYPTHFLIQHVRDSSKCYKKFIIGDTRYFGRYGVSSDNAFSLLVALKASKFAFLASNGYLWTLRDNSLSNRKLFKYHHKDFLYIWSCFYKSILSNYSKSELPDLIVNDYIHLFHVHLVCYGSYFFKNIFTYYKSFFLYLKLYKVFKLKVLPFKYFLRLSLPYLFTKMIYFFKNKNEKK